MWVVMWSDQDGLEHRVPVVCGLGQSNLVNVQFACGRRFRVLNVVEDVTLECSAKQPIKLKSTRRVRGKASHDAPPKDAEGISRCNLFERPHARKTSIR